MRRRISTCHPVTRTCSTTRRNSFCRWSKSRGVERVEAATCEVVDAVAQLVVGGEFGPLGGEGAAFGVEAGVAGVDVLGAALQLDEFDQPGLVEVDESASFLDGGGELAVELGELGGEQVVVAGGSGGGECVLAGEEEVGAGERVADLVEHVV